MYAQYKILNSKLEGKKYLCGDEPTIADFQLCAQALDFALIGTSYESYSNINRWRREMILNTEGFTQVHEEFFKSIGNFSCVQFEPLEAAMHLE